jgi:hypothetical protein
MDTITITGQLAQLGRDLDRAVEKLAELEEIAVDAEGSYRGRYAALFRAAAGPVEDRKQAAIEQTGDLWSTWQKAASAVRLQRDGIKALVTRIDIGRTLQSTARAEMQMAGTGVTP